jgi:hypothetical protein
MNKTQFQQARQKPVKLLIGIPTRGDLKADMALSLSFMIHHISVNPVVMIDNEPRFLMWQVTKIATSLLPQSRQNMVDMAIKSEVDYLLMIDDDMVFNHELAHDWMAENRPVIACNCPTRSIPCYPTARQFDPKEEFKGALVYSDTAKYRWERVWRVGTGVMMLRADVLKGLPRPAFTPRWEEGNDAYVGEDWVLCEHLEARGTPIIVDHEHSLPIGHVGDMEFKHEMVAGTRRKIAAQSGIITPSIIVPKKGVPDEQSPNP